MGNKSKTNGAKQSAKWAERRNMAKARQPKSWTQWGGMASEAAAPVKSTRITGGHVVANLSPATRVGRQLHMRMGLPVLHNSSRAGTYRNAKPLNSQTGV